MQGEEQRRAERVRARQREAGHFVVMLVRVVALEKIRLDFQDPIEAERVALQNLIERNSASLGFVNDRRRIHRTNPLLDRHNLFRRYETGLVDYDNVGEGGLRLMRGLELADETLGVDHGHDRVEPGASARVLIDEECLSHRRLGSSG